MTLDGCHHKDSYPGGGKSLPITSAERPSARTPFACRTAPSFAAFRCHRLFLRLPCQLRLFQRPRRPSVFLPSPIQTNVKPSEYRHQLRRIMDPCRQHYFPPSSYYYAKAPLRTLFPQLEVQRDGEKKLLTAAASGRIAVTSSCRNSLHLCLSLRPPRDE